jgi:hypothetical protein
MNVSSGRSELLTRRREALARTGSPSPALNVAAALSIEAARLELVRDNLVVEADYLNRLSGVLKTVTDANSSGPTPGQRMKARITRWMARLRSVRRLPGLVGLIPTFIRQLSSLQRAFRAGPEARHLVVCIASNRLQIVHDDIPFRSELTTLTTALGGGASPFEDVITRADVVFIFDALPVSRLWNEFRRANQRDIVILDGAFLAFFFCSRLLTSAGRRGVLQAVREGLRRETREVTSFSTPKSLLYALIVSAIWQALRGPARKEGLFLTSNSTLPELLRICLVQSLDCDRISELMHGVGSAPAEAIFASGVELGRAYGAHRKLVFVPQIPGLPLDGVFRNLAFDPGTAVNCYLNQYFMRRRGQDFEASITDEFERLRTRASVGDDPIVITIFGNAANADRGIDSPSFRAESALIGLMGRLSRATGREHMIVYAPHPALGQAPSGHAQFVLNRVQVHPDSVFCWLISDLCVALSSSAMFEAAWFGASALTPMIPEDRFFSSPYLIKLFHPAASTSEDLEKVTRAFLDSWSREPGVGVAQRAKYRLRAMIGSAPRESGCRVTDILANS